MEKFFFFCAVRGKYQQPKVADIRCFFFFFFKNASRFFILKIKNAKRFCSTLVSTRTSGVSAVQTPEGGLFFKD
jgi:hypothetical protein